MRWERGELKNVKLLSKTFIFAGGNVIRLNRRLKHVSDSCSAVSIELFINHSMVSESLVQKDQTVYVSDRSYGKIQTEHSITFIDKKN